MTITLEKRDTSMIGTTGASVSFELNPTKGLIPERFEAVRSGVNGSRRDSFSGYPLVRRDGPGWG